MKKIKKSTLAMLVTCLVLIPLTLYLGTFLSGRSYYITATLFIIELLIPFLMAFEGRKPQARELVLIAIMCAIAIVGRVAIPIPHVKATFAIIFISGIAFGPETGFMIGAVTAFASNFFYGQGAFTPWQMMAYGAGGMLAGFLFKKKRLPRNPPVMAIFGFFAVLLWVGPLLDCSGLFLMAPTVSFSWIVSYFAAGFPINLSQAISTVVIMLVFGKPLLDILDRIRRKYGMQENEPEV